MGASSEDWPGIVGSERVEMQKEMQKERRAKERRRMEIEAEANGAAELLEMEMRYARDAESRIRDTNALDSAMYWGPSGGEQESGGSMFWGATAQQEGHDLTDEDGKRERNGKSMQHLSVVHVSESCCTHLPHQQGKATGTATVTTRWTLRSG